MTYTTFTEMHAARNAVHFAAWEAARALNKEERKIERAMCTMANKMAREMIDQMWDLK